MYGEAAVASELLFVAISHWRIFVGFYAREGEGGKEKKLKQN